MTPSALLQLDGMFWATLSSIEQRAPNEVRFAGGGAIAPPDADVRNPAFDVTPAELIAGVITDKGVYRAPYSFIYEMRSRD